MVDCADYDYTATSIYWAKFEAADLRASGLYQKVIRRGLRVRGWRKTSKEQE